MISCVIIDDEPLARKGMREYISDVDFLHLAGEYDNPLKATEMISRRLAICSIKTEIAPKPWSKRSVKLMLDLPAYLFPLAV